MREVRKMKRALIRKQVGAANVKMTWEMYQKQKYGDDYFVTCVVPQFNKRARGRYKKEQDALSKLEKMLQNVPIKNEEVAIND